MPLPGGRSTTVLTGADLVITGTTSARFAALFGRSIAEIAASQPDSRLRVASVFGNDRPARGSSCGNRWTRKLWQSVPGRWRASAALLPIHSAPLSSVPSRAHLPPPASCRATIQCRRRAIVDVALTVVLAGYVAVSSASIPPRDAGTASGRRASDSGGAYPSYPALRRGAVCPFRSTPPVGALSSEAMDLLPEAEPRYRNCDHSLIRRSRTPLIAPWLSERTKRRSR
jgi:hypothetical protein